MSLPDFSVRRPVTVFMATVAVTIVYLALNLVFVGFVPCEDVMGRPDVAFAAMMEYDGDLKLPRHYLVQPPAIDRTMGEYLARNEVTQFACSETQKYGHVTYFWNGNRTGMFDEVYEEYVEIASDVVPFEQRPWMKAAEITDALGALGADRAVQR